MNEPWAIESILNGTGGGGGGGGNPIPPITNIYVPVDEWKYQDRIIDVVGFPWVADVPYPNVKASDFVSVIFGQEDAESGIFSNVCESRTDAVRIFASEKPTKRIRIDTLSGFRPNASNSIWGHITGDIQNQQDLVDFVGDSNKIETIKANGTELSIVDKAVNIPIATDSTAGLNFAYNSSGYTVYVSPDGDDTTGDGTSEKPFREIRTAITKSKGYNSKRVSIVCEAGEYSGFGIFQEDCPIPDYTLYANGSITINGRVTIFNNNLLITSASSEFSVTISTTNEIGVVVGRMGNIISQIPLTIIAGKYGIDANISGASIILHNVNITLNNDDARYGIVFFQTGTIIARNVTVNSVSGTGVAVGLENSSVGVVWQIQANVTKYNANTSSLLSIGGKWVNQS